MTSFKNILIGSVCVATGCLLFATNDAILKYSGLKESQLLIGRFAIQLTIAIIWWTFCKPKQCHNWYGDKPHIMNIWARGLFYSMNVIAVVYAFIRLPVGDATCIYLQSPAITSILAWIFLGEKLPKTTPSGFNIGMIFIIYSDKKC